MIVNVIGDVAGQYRALRTLLDLMPEGDFLCVGDLVDRGPDSRRVIDFVKRCGSSLMGNHEHMMLDWWDRRHGPEYYDQIAHYWNGCWIANGGEHTLRSYPDRQVDPAHIEWLRGLPISHIDHERGYIVTHAPINADLTVERALGIVPADDMSVLWNRSYPELRDGYFQVFGHNSHWGLRWFGGSPQQAWGVCLDASRDRILTGIHLPSRTIYQVPYGVEWTAVDAIRHRDFDLPS